MEQQQATLGTDFAHAFAAKDADRIRELVHPEIDFRALTPNRNWEASDLDKLVSMLFDEWLEDSDEVEGIESVESDSFADRERVGYRLAVRCPRRQLPRRAAGLHRRARREDRLDAGRVLRLPAYLSPFSSSTTPNTSPSR